MSHRILFRKNFLVLTVILLLFTSCNLLPDRSRSDTHEATFPGGIQALKRWLGENINYPQKAIEEEIEGRVFIRFVVTKDGSVQRAVVMKTVHPLLDAEAVRVVSRMPAWEPAMKNGKAVECEYNLPVSFKLY